MDFEYKNSLEVYKINYFNILPFEILAIIFIFIGDIDELIKLRLICKKFRIISIKL